MIEKDASDLHMLAGAPQAARDGGHRERDTRK